MQTGDINVLKRTVLMQHVKVLVLPVLTFMTLMGRIGVAKSLAPRHQGGQQSLGRSGKRLLHGSIKLVVKSFLQIAVSRNAARKWATCASRKTKIGHLVVLGVSLGTGLVIQVEIGAVKDWARVHTSHGESHPFFVSQWCSLPPIMRPA